VDALKLFTWFTQLLLLAMPVTTMEAAVASANTPSPEGQTMSRRECWSSIHIVVKQTTGVMKSTALGGSCPSVARELLRFECASVR
jgi:hypothetical protein